MKGRRALVAAGIAYALASGCRDEPQAVFTDLVKARHVAGDLRVQMTKVTDMSNRAVMADTDEESTRYAREAEHLQGFVKSDVVELQPRLRHLGDKAAAAALETFERRFAEYEKANREVLGLAVENTNLKAQKLSFGPARQAADALRDSLNTAAAAVAPKDRCRADALAAVAVTAVREIQVLHAPHIAERQDPVMAGLEKQMEDLEAKARHALKEFGGLVGAKGKAALAEAAAALERFSGISKEIVKLSRRNTNVVSLELALRRMPVLSASCDESLQALVDALAKDPFPATR